LMQYFPYIRLNAGSTGVEAAILLIAHNTTLNTLSFPLLKMKNQCFCV
jgi:hypothetical protein